MSTGLVKGKFSAGWPILETHYTLDQMPSEELFFSELIEVTLITSIPKVGLQLVETKAL